MRANPANRERLLTSGTDIPPATCSPASDFPTCALPASNIRRIPA